MSLSVFKFYVLNANLGVRRFKIGRNTMNMNFEGISVSSFWSPKFFKIQEIFYLRATIFARTGCYLCPPQVLYRSHSVFQGNSACTLLTTTSESNLNLSVATTVN